MTQCVMDILKATAMSEKKRRMLDENQLTFMAAAAAGRSVDDVILDATDISAKVGFLGDCSTSVLTAW